MVPVLWLKQTDQAGVFRHSFKSDILVSSIIGEVVVTEKGKTVVLDMSEMKRLECLVKKLENEERGEGKGIEGIEERKEKMVSDDMKTSESCQEVEMHCKKTKNTVDTEPYIVEIVNTKMMLEQLDATMDLVGRNMFMSFRSLEDMRTYAKLVKGEETFVPKIVEKKVKGRILPKTLSDDSPAVPGDISVLHMKVEENGQVDSKKESMYELVTNIVEDLLSRLWEDIDTEDKQTEEEETWVPQIEKDQSCVPNLKKFNVEVTADLPMVGKEKAKDEKVITFITEENPQAKQLENSDSNKRKAMRCFRSLEDVTAYSTLVGEEDQTFKKVKLATLSEHISEDNLAVLDMEEDCRDLSALHMEVEDNEEVEQMGNDNDWISDIMEDLLDRLWEDIDTVEQPGSGGNNWVQRQQLDNGETDEILSTPDPVDDEEKPPAKHDKKAVNTSDPDRRGKSPKYSAPIIKSIENHKSMNEEKENKRVEKSLKGSDSTKWLKRPNYLVCNMNNNVKDYSSDSGRMRGRISLGKEVKGRRARRCLSCEPCLRADCGLCVRCQDMTKFGGSGRLKKACLGRICENMEVAPNTTL